MCSGGTGAWPVCVNVVSRRAPLVEKQASACCGGASEPGCLTSGTHARAPDGEEAKQRRATHTPRRQARVASLLARPARGRYQEAGQTHIECWCVDAGASARVVCSVDNVGSPCELGQGRARSGGATRTSAARCRVGGRSSEGQMFKRRAANSASPAWAGFPAPSAVRWSCCVDGHRLRN